MSELRSFVFFIGLPACGKGTQAQYLEQVGYETVPMSEILSGLRDPDSPDLVADEIAIPALSRHVSGMSSTKLLFDGFPRTVSQADFAMDQNGDSIRTRFIVFRVSEEVVLDRLFGPDAKDRGRPDDTPEIVRERIALFWKNTDPILNHIKRRAPGTIFEVNGVGSLEEVRDCIFSALGLVPASV